MQTCCKMIDDTAFRPPCGVFSQVRTSLLGLPNAHVAPLTLRVMGGKRPGKESREWDSLRRKKHHSGDYYFLVVSLVAPDKKWGLYCSRSRCRCYKYELIQVYYQVVAIFGIFLSYLHHVFFWLGRQMCLKVWPDKCLGTTTTWSKAELLRSSSTQALVRRCFFVTSLATGSGSTSLSLGGETFKQLFLDLGTLY